MTDFIERQKGFALAREQERAALRRAIERIVFGSREAGRYRLGHVVTVQEDPEFSRAYQDGQPADELTALGSYVVEVIERVDRITEKSMWTTANEGISDSWRWWSVDQALLHLISIRHGDPDHRGEAVTYASRVLGFSDFPEDGHA